MTAPPMRRRCLFGGDGRDLPVEDFEPAIAHQREPFVAGPGHDGKQGVGGIAGGVQRIGGEQIGQREPGNDVEREPFGVRERGGIDGRGRRAGGHERAAGPLLKRERNRASMRQAFRG